MTLTEFANLLVETKNTNYELEKQYVFGEVRQKFNELINFSARYSKGRKIIPFKNVVNLKLSFRDTDFVSYPVAFARFVEKCKNKKYASQWGLITLNYSHNTYI